MTRARVQLQNFLKLVSLGNHPSSHLKIKVDATIPDTRIGSEVVICDTVGLVLAVIAKAFALCSSIATMEVQAI